MPHTGSELVLLGAGLEWTQRNPFAPFLQSPNHIVGRKSDRNALASIGVQTQLDLVPCLESRTGNTINLRLGTRLAAIRLRIPEEIYKQRVGITFLGCFRYFVDGWIGCLRVQAKDIVLTSPRQQRFLPVRNRFDRHQIVQQRIAKFQLKLSAVFQYQCVVSFPIHQLDNFCIPNASLLARGFLEITNQSNLKFGNTAFLNAIPA